MTNGKLVSYNTIVENVMRNHPWAAQRLNDEQALEWLGSFMQHTNSPVVYEDKIEYLEVEAGRVKLPSDLYLLNTIANVVDYDMFTIEQLKCGEGCLSPMRWATDVFHTRYHSNDCDYRCNNVDASYTVNSNYAFTSFSTGVVAISYKAIPTDIDGYPMIPADEQWVKAAEFELAYRIGYILWTEDKLKDKVFALLERERDWYFAQAVNYSKIPSVDQMESLKNHTINTKPKVNAHSNFFSNLQVPERRHWRHNR